MYVLISFWATSDGGREIENVELYNNRENAQKAMNKMFEKPNLSPSWVPVKKRKYDEFCEIDCEDKNCCGEYCWYSIEIREVSAPTEE